MRNAAPIAGGVPFFWPKIPPPEAPTLSPLSFHPIRRDTGRRVGRLAQGAIAAPDEDENDLRHR